MNNNVIAGNYYTIKEYGFVKVIGIYPENGITMAEFKVLDTGSVLEMPLNEFSQSRV